MPEFKSRIDSYNWHTPLFSDIFSMDDIPSSDEALIESNQARLAAALARLASAVQLDTSRAMPSYTLYEANLEQNLADEELREKIYKIEAQEGWILGYNWQNSKRVQFLLRTGAHHPLTLSHVISRITFRKSAHLASFVVGVTLQQQILVRDWDSLGHLLIVGDGGTKQSFVRSILVTLLMLQTPSELRIAFVGGSDEHRYIQDVPHALGENSFRNPDQSMRLLFGMAREVKRRQNIFKDLGCRTLGAANRQLLDCKSAPLPRIVLVLDSLGQADWVKYQSTWMPPLREILKHGAQVGIHAIITARGLHLPHPFDEISREISSQLITRTAAADTHFMQAVDPFHPSLVRFVDGFFIEDGKIIPVELPSVTAYDAKAVQSYWEKNASERLALKQLTSIQQPKTITGILGTGDNLPNPPIPEKPPATALVRAAEILAERNGTVHNSPLFLTVTEKPKPEIIPALKVEVVKPKYIDMQVNMEHLRRAQALATYLGWLGRGPLIDVLGLSIEEADMMIAILQARQILERGSNPTPHLHPRRRRPNY